MSNIRTYVGSIACFVIIVGIAYLGIWALVLLLKLLLLPIAISIAVFFTWVVYDVVQTYKRGK